MILHTAYAFAVTVDQYQPTVQVADATSLCDLSVGDLSYVYNLDYTMITEDSCDGLSDAKTIELVVRLQERNITEGRTISVANKIEFGAYFVLISLAVWWGSLSHWLYTWDTFVWIAGFAAIEMILSEWRDEIEEESGLIQATG